MFKLLAVCLLAFALAKLNKNVQATEDLDAEEKHLLQLLEEGKEQDKRDFDLCGTEACDDDCQLDCCIDECDDMDCLADCYDIPDKRTAAVKQAPMEKQTDVEKKVFMRFLRRRRSRRAIGTLLRRLVRG